jgi:16S rRNA (cytidine1402-2'-O)-methyltransferase
MSATVPTKTTPILYLLPVPIVPEAWHTLSPEAINVASTCRHFYVENLRSARRFLKGVFPEKVIDDCFFEEMLKDEPIRMQPLRTWMGEGHPVAIVSEAGCPGVADPGAQVVAAAHQLGAAVRPLVGPSSLLLALMASGMNGQSFAFNGYLPVKAPERGQKIRFYEQRAIKEGQTQLFIETPYRNNALLTDLLQHCQPSTRICIAQNIGLPEAFIQTRPATAWKKQLPDLPKAPAVFLIGL